MANVCFYFSLTPIHHNFISHIRIGNLTWNLNAMRSHSAREMFLYLSNWCACLTTHIGQHTCTEHMETSAVPRQSSIGLSITTKRYITITSFITFTFNPLWRTHNCLQKGIPQCEVTKHRHLIHKGLRHITFTYVYNTEERYQKYKFCFPWTIHMTCINWLHSLMRKHCQIYY